MSKSFRGVAKETPANRKRKPAQCHFTSISHLRRWHMLRSGWMGNLRKKWRQILRRSLQVQDSWGTFAWHTQAKNGKKHCFANANHCLLGISWHEWCGRHGLWIGEFFQSTCLRRRTRPTEREGREARSLDGWRIFKVRTSQFWVNCKIGMRASKFLASSAGSEKKWLIWLSFCMFLWLQYDNMITYCSFALVRFVQHCAVFLKDVEQHVFLFPKPMASIGVLWVGKEL